MLFLLLLAGAVLAAPADAEGVLDEAHALCLMSTSHFLGRELGGKEDLSMFELGTAVGEGLEVEESRVMRFDTQFLANVEVSSDAWEAMVLSKKIPVCPSASGNDELVIEVETPSSACYATHVRMFDEDDITYLEDFFGDNVDMSRVAFYNKNVEIDPYTHHFQVEETTVVVQGWDLSGNSNKCKKNIRVVDKTPPVWTPSIENYDSKITLEYPGNACVKNSAAVFKAYERQTRFTPAATDNCKVKWFKQVVLKGAEPNTEFLWEGPEGSADTPNFRGPGDWTICYYAEDTHGNKMWHNVTVEMVDATPPDNITCPPERVFVEVEAHETSGYVSWEMPRVVSDNCFAHGVLPPPEEEKGNAFDYYEVGETPISYTLKDAFENAYEGECMFTIEVKPKAHPVVITCPADVTVKTLKWTRFATVTWPQPEVEQGGKPLSQDHVWYEHNILPGSAFPYGTTTVMVHARGELTGDRTREEDMTDNCTFLVHVVDEEAPQPDGRHFRCSNATGKKPFSVCGGSVIVPDLHHDFIDTHVFSTEGFHTMDEHGCCDSELGVVHDCSATPSVMYGGHAVSRVKYCYPRELPTEQEACSKCVTHTPAPTPVKKPEEPAEGDVITIPPETTTAPTEPSKASSRSTPAPEAATTPAPARTEATPAPKGSTPAPARTEATPAPRGSTPAPTEELVVEEEETTVVPATPLPTHEGFFVNPTERPPEPKSTLPPAPAESTPLPAESTPLPAESTPSPAESTPSPAESTPSPEAEEDEEDEEEIVVPAGTTASPSTPSPPPPPTPLPTHEGSFEAPTRRPTTPSPTPRAATEVPIESPEAPTFPPRPPPDRPDFIITAGPTTAAPSLPADESVIVSAGPTTAAPSAPADGETFTVTLGPSEGPAEPSLPPEEEEIDVPATPLPTHEGFFVNPTHGPEPEPEVPEIVIVTPSTTPAAPSAPSTGTAEPEPETLHSCSKRVDLVLLLDASMSVESALRAEIKKFAKDLITAVMGSGNSSRIGVAWFARDVGVVSELTDDSRTLLSELELWNPDVGVTTEAALALMRGKEMLDTGGREDAEKVILLVYDGLPTNVNHYKYADYSIDAQAEAIKAAGIDLAVGLVSSITGDKERAETRSRAWSHRSVVTSPWEQHLMTDISVHAMLEHVNNYLDAICHDHHSSGSTDEWHPEGLPWQTLSCVEDVCGMLETTEEVDAAIKAVDEWRKLDYAALASMPDSMRGLEAKFDCMMKVENGQGNDHPWQIKHCNSDLSSETGFKESWLKPSPGVSLNVKLVEEQFDNVTSYDGVKLACPDGLHVIGGGCQALDSPFTVGISAHWGLNGDGWSKTSGWTCAYDGLKNPGFIARGGRMLVRALCSEKVVVTGTNGIRSFTTQPEPQPCDRHRGKVIGGGCSTIDPEDTNWLTLASVSVPRGGPVFGELKPITNGTMMQCAKSGVYRMTSAICIQGPMDDDIYQVENSGPNARCERGDFLVGGGCSAADNAPLSACLPGGREGRLKWKCAAQGGGAVTSTAVCLRHSSTSLAQLDATLLQRWFG